VHEPLYNRSSEGRTMLGALHGASECAIEEEDRRSGGEGERENRSGGEEENNSEGEGRNG